MFEKKKKKKYPQLPWKKKVPCGATFYYIVDKRTGYKHSSVQTHRHEGLVNMKRGNKIQGFLFFYVDAELFLFPF